MTERTGRLEGKVAIVTGAARGMGEAEARLFAAEGGSVVLADVLEPEGRKVADDIGERAAFEPLDVTDEDAWRRLLDSATRHFGTPDVLVNNAGILRVTPILTADMSEVRRVIDVNLVGTFLGLRVIGGAMVAAQRGSIINISSTAGLTGQSTIGAYVASKWGVRGLTKVAALEFGPSGVRVNSLHPGGMTTAMLGVTGYPALAEPPPRGAVADDPAVAAVDAMVSRVPLRRAGRPVEVARMALFLASDEASYCTGMEFVVDGGSLAGMEIEGRL
jgi:3alpha(or 20beta)-hydroxysteroid dehydrogenase